MESMMKSFKSLLEGAGERMPEIRITNDLVNNEEFLKFVRSDEYALFLYLQAHIVRGQLKKKVIDLYKEYYKEGLLATQWNQKSLAEKFNVDKRTIKRWVRALSDRGFIKIEKAIKGTTEVGNKKVYIKWNVYILGEVKFGKSKTIESLYYVKVLNKEDAAKALEKHREWLFSDDEL